MTKQQPMQPIFVEDGEGSNVTHRFQKNAVVEHLHREYGPGMNTLVNGNFSLEDMAQFYQLIGYDVSGYRDFDDFERLHGHAIDEELMKLAGLNDMHVRIRLGAFNSVVAEYVSPSLVEAIGNNEDKNSAMLDLINDWAFNSEERELNVSYRIYVSPIMDSFTVRRSEKC